MKLPCFGEGISQVIEWFFRESPSAIGLDWIGLGPPFDSTIVKDQNSPWSQTLVGAFVSASKYVKKKDFKISVYIYKSLA